jgi:bifunctional ADP-heptose synthase (sugar kinase/adenylyltransferase)
MNGESRTDPEHSKLSTLDALAQLVHRARAAGRHVVHVRGVFDLLNDGHIQRLETARRQGDMLVVTLRSDARLGDERPLLDERLRAEVLARLQCVDHVAVEGPLSPDEALAAVGADTCVDGVDGKASPGRPVSDDGLPYSAEARAFLREFRRSHPPEAVIERLGELSGLRVLVVGDAIIDEYHFVRPYGMPLKAPTIAAQFLEGEAHAGGILAVANHVAGFCKEVHLVTALGARDTREAFVRRHLAKNVEPALFIRPDGPTTVKRRYVRKFLVQKLFEVSFFNDEPLPRELDLEISRYLRQIVADYDLVIVADFGQGFVSHDMIEVLCRQARFLALNAQLNSVNMGYHVVTRYPRADYVCIDEDEVRMACRDRYSPLSRLVEDIAGELKAKLMAVTRGHHGSITCQPGHGAWTVPVLSREVVDTVGAGDAYLAITAPCAAAGFPPELIGFIGNAVGALAVKILGNQQPVTPEMLFASARELLE